MYEDAEIIARSDDQPAVDNEVPGPVKERSSLWALIALGLLALLLIWILLGVWRYLQVLGYGGF